MTLQLTIDEKETQSVIKELTKLSGSDRPLRFSAREMLAYVYLDEELEDKAQEIFVKLATNPQTPQGIKQRAQAFAKEMPPTEDDNEPLSNDMAGE
jgi:hypothetical protein